MSQSDSSKERTTLIHSFDEIPPFKNEDEEREWWATHDFAPELQQRPGQADCERFALWQSRARRAREQRSAVTA